MLQADLAVPPWRTQPLVLQADKVVSLKDYEPQQQKTSRRNPDGAEARADIACLLESLGCRVGQRVAVGESIYGTRLHADVVAEACPRWSNGLAVQVYAQATAGSADQKFPYFVANIKQRLAIPTVIVLVGDGFSAGSEEWLLAQVDGEHLIAVLTVADFEHWVTSFST